MLTTGYLENVSHSGADGALGYELKLKSLAVLAGVDVEELKSAVDFWITDRAGDCGKLLEGLGIEEEKILKCCAHVILGVDHSIDKVFRDTEGKIGVQKLLGKRHSYHHQTPFILWHKLQLPSYCPRAMLAIQCHCSMNIRLGWKPTMLIMKGSRVSLPTVSGALQKLLRNSWPGGNL